MGYQANAASAPSRDEMLRIADSLKPVGPDGRPLTPNGPPAEECFTETAFCISGRFLDRWRTTGGARINGFPLSAEFAEQLEDGETYTVQYFERVRLEHHPENPAPYDVLLGQFGRRLYEADPPVGPGQNTPQYFPETGHNLSGQFYNFWREYGLAQFGYPLSEERTETLEDGQTYRVQYFERARLEYHPENPYPYQILIGQFGRRILDESRQPADPVGAPAIVPSRPDAPPGEPTYTEADVRDYVDRSGLPLLKLKATGPYTIERIEFQTGAEAARRDLPIGPPPDRLYCLATLRGTFTLTAPPTPPDPQPQTLIYRTVTLIFDGRTGNALGAQARP